RLGEPAVVARVYRDRLLLDPRTVAPKEDTALLEALRRALRRWPVCAGGGGPVWGARGGAGGGGATGSAGTARWWGGAWAARARSWRRGGPPANRPAPVRQQGSAQGPAPRPATGSRGSRRQRGPGR